MHKTKFDRIENRKFIVDRCIVNDQQLILIEENYFLSLRY